MYAGPSSAVCCCKSSDCVRVVRGPCEVLWLLMPIGQQCCSCQWQDLATTPGPWELRSGTAWQVRCRGQAGEAAPQHSYWAPFNRTRSPRAPGVGSPSLTKRERRLQRSWSVRGMRSAGQGTRTKGRPCSPFPGPSPDPHPQVTRGQGAAPPGPAARDKARLAHSGIRGGARFPSAERRPTPGAALAQPPSGPRAHLGDGHGEVDKEPGGGGDLQGEDGHDGHAAPQRPAPPPPLPQPPGIGGRAVPQHAGGRAAAIGAQVLPGAGLLRGHGRAVAPPAPKCPQLRRDGPERGGDTDGGGPEWEWGWSSGFGSSVASGVGSVPHLPPARQERGGGCSCAARMGLSVLCEPHEAGRAVEVQGSGTSCCRRWRIPALLWLGTGGLGVGWTSYLGDADHVCQGSAGYPKANVCRKVLIAVEPFPGAHPTLPTAKKPSWTRVLEKYLAGSSVWLFSDC